MKITQEEYKEFIRNFYQGKYPELRFGQAFFCYLNNNNKITAMDPELFYCDDIKTAIKLITERYLQ